VSDIPEKRNGWRPSYVCLSSKRLVAWQVPATPLLLGRLPLSYLEQEEANHVQSLNRLMIDYAVQIKGASRCARFLKCLAFLYATIVLAVTSWRRQVSQWALEELKDARERLHGLPMRKPGYLVAGQQLIKSYVGQSKTNPILSPEAQKEKEHLERTFGPYFEKQYPLEPRETPWDRHQRHVVEYRKHFTQRAR